MKRFMVAAMLLWQLPVQGAEVVSTLDDQSAVAVTIYNDDLALVKDQRRVALATGENRLAFREVSAKIRPETALLRSLGGGDGLRLIEQNFDFDLLTPDKLLEKYIGREVRVIRTHPTTGEEAAETAQVLATNDGVVLRMGDRIETGIPGRIVFDGVPENLRDRPTLVIRLLSPAGGKREVELSYLTGGLSWQADYVAALDGEDKHLSLNGWVTLTNQSGTAYRDALLQLVAGDVHRAPERRRLRMAEESVMAAAAPDAAMRQEGLFEYHLYTLERPTTLADRQTKQVALLSAEGVPVTKEFLLEGRQHDYYNRRVGAEEQRKVAVYLEFRNDEQGNLGLPLPKGVMRIYKADSAGRGQFLGEDRIDHTPKNEKVRLKLGNAFDVTARRKQTGFKRRPAQAPYKQASDSSYEITLKNAKTEAVTVIVREPIPGDWEMLGESQPHRKEAANLAEWRVEVPAEGEATLSYEVRVRY
ncbi:MAG: DUF4139 domain-containing protein [Pseudomonadota bacterium]|nr:DUF4139 domain-containing protein [Pseudomonadota bacterium]